MNHDELDPVDLLLDGKVDKAIQSYLDLYIAALDRSDYFIGQDLATQLHYCLALKFGNRDPEELSENVEGVIYEELHKRGLEVEQRVVRDHVAVARSAVKAARQRSDKSIAAVEIEDKRWYEAQDQ